MTLLFCDSFDHYSTSEIINKWYTGGCQIEAASGRNGTAALRNDSISSYVYKSLSSSYDTLYVGFAVKPAAIDGSDRAFIRFYEGSTLHTDIRVEALSGKIKATRNGTQLGISTNQVIFADTWVHLQVKVYIHDSAGTVDVLANGVNVLSISGVDTQNGGTGVINRVALYGITDSYAYFDDFWLDDSEFLGDCRIECLFPSGAGATTAWTASSGNNYECVDEATPNSDTDYVSSSTADQIDTYAFGNLATTAGAVKGVQVSAFARKDDAGSRNIALVARPGSTDRAGDTQALSDSYTYYSQIWETNPDTSAVWTISEVNASEFGVKLVS